LFCKLLRSESGYSLVEVIVAMMILTVAILPMMSMFDAGLRASNLGSNYDKARALANEKLEEIKALSFRDPDNPAGAPANSILEKYKPVNEPSTASGGLGPGSPVTGTSGIFSYTVTTRYVQQDFNTIPATPIRTSFVKVTVQVSWQGKSITVTSIRVVNV
jgi:prepilin-type N-terminal cleavage/methylation domain-containing protein